MSDAGVESKVIQPKTEMGTDLNNTESVLTPEMFQDIETAGEVAKAVLASNPENLEETFSAKLRESINSSITDEQVNAEFAKMDFDMVDEGQEKNSIRDEFLRERHTGITTFLRNSSKSLAEQIKKIISQPEGGLAEILSRAPANDMASAVFLYDTRADLCQATNKKGNKEVRLAENYINRSEPKSLTSSIQDTINKGLSGQYLNKLKPLTT